VTAGEQVTMPTQDRIRLHQQPQPAQLGPGQMVQQCRQPRPVGPIEPHPLAIELALQDRELVPQGENLGIFIAVAAREQPQERERVRDPQIRQPQQHDPASSPSHQHR
jgi:hypothetical protein